MEAYLRQIYAIYYQFLSYFPPRYHFIVSLALALLLVYAIYKVIKRNFIFIILLVLLLPQSVPILKTVWEGALKILEFLINRR
ncbi:MAG: hypothetical protein HY397_02875 [Candidatus Doudnabacteria bacterium]|nr:hypothetical protein [Candidatus Doudnabacteria bacterium]